jgi:hypothetical protein
MILEEATKEAFDYYSTDLTYGSDMPILAACELCGAFRVLKRCDYCSLCISCAQKGRILTEEHKAKIGAALKGKKRTAETKARICVINKGKTRTEEHKANISAALKGKFGEKSNAWKGGKKVYIARANGKRRELGHKLLMPLANGEVGHHFTDEYVLGIPAEVHESIGGRRRRHRMKVLQWLKANDKKKYDLVVAVLANMS